MSSRISRIPGFFDRYATSYTPKDIRIMACESPEGETRRLFVTRMQSTTHLYLKIPTSVVDILSLPNDIIVKQNVIPPRNSHHWCRDVELVYQFYFRWDKKRAERILRNHYANTHVQPERHRAFKALGGYRRLKSASEWLSWIDEHWPDTRDHWWDIGFVLLDEYSSLLNDLKEEYKI